MASELTTTAVLQPECISAMTILQIERCRLAEGVRDCNGAVSTKFKSIHQLWEVESWAARPTWRSRNGTASGSCDFWSGMVVWL